MTRHGVLARPKLILGVFWVVCLVMACFNGVATGAIPANKSDDPLADTTVVDEEVMFGVVEMRLNGSVLPEFQEVLHGDMGHVWLDLESLVVFAEGLFRRDKPGRYSVNLYGDNDPVVLDAVESLIIYPQSKISFSQTAIRFDQDRLFVEKRALEEYFGLYLTTRLDEGYLDVSSTRPLPRDLRLLRERSWRRLGRTNGAPEQPLPTMKIPYHLAGGVIADLQLGSFYESRSDKTTTRMSLSAASELLFLTNRFFIAASDDGIDSLRWTAGREDPRGGLFGIESLESFSLGDVVGQSISLVGSGARGRGLKFQAAPLQLSDGFSSTTIDGDAPPGWDAELYVAGQLRDFQRISDDGRYRFNDVDLFYGTNVIVVRLYSPTGEVRLVDYSASVSPGILPPEKFYVWGSILEPGQDVWPLNDSTGSSGGLAYSLRSDVGITDHLSISLQASSLPGAGLDDVDSARQTDREFYVGSEIRTRFANMSASVGHVHQHTTGGAAWHLNLGASALRYPFNLRIESADPSFSSGYIGEGLQALKQRIRLSTAFTVGKRKKFSIPVYVERVTTHGGSVTDSLNTVYSSQFGAVHLTHDVRFNRSSNPAGDWSEFNGWYRGLLAYDFNQYQYRTEYSAVISPGFASQYLNLQGSYRQNDRTNYHLGYSYSFAGSHGISAGFSRDIGDLFVLGGGISHTDDDTVINLRLTFSFSGDKQAGLHLSNRQRATYGAARLQVFHDDNGDGIRQRQEQGHPLVDVVHNRIFLDNTTDDDGQLLLWGLDHLSEHWLKIGREQLAAEFRTSPNSDFLLWPRPGRIFSIDIPVIDATYVSGKIYYQTGDGLLHGLGLSEVRARTSDGSANFVTRALSDGFFSFEHLYPGEWEIEAESSRLGHSGQSPKVARTIEILPGDIDVHDVKVVFPYTLWSGNAVKDVVEMPLETLPVVKASAPVPLPAPENLRISPALDDHYESPDIFLQRWADAWSMQDVETYLGFYASDYIPAGGIDRHAWEKVRRERLSKPTTIQVVILDLNEREVDGDLVQIEVVQQYQSNLYADISRKLFDLRRTDSHWEIVRERTVSITPLTR